MSSSGDVPPPDKSIWGSKLNFLFRISIVAACIIFFLLQVDLRSFYRELVRLPLFPLLVMELIFLCCLLPLGQRLKYLLNGSVSLKQSFEAVLFCQGINAMAPTRLGEIAKAIYLHREGGMTMSRAVEAIFWERWTDVNFLLLTLCLVVVLFGVPAGLPILLAVVCVVWGGVFVIKARPAWGRRIIGLLPPGKVHGFFEEGLELLIVRMSSFPFAGLVLLTALGWICGLVFNGLVLNWAIGLDLTMLQVLAVFAAGVVGVAIPGAPGGLGVYEAAVMGALLWAGVPEGQALASALVLHLLQLLPTAVGALILMSVKRLRFVDLRTRS